jgi:hypothetical protein
MLTMNACEKGYTAEEETKTGNESNVTLRVKSIEMVPFENTTISRASTEMSELCSRLQFAVFKDGEKKKNISQQAGDAGFGEAAISLPEGDYQLVVMGHSCTGTATITDLEKITFPNNKVTDTFYYYGTFTVGNDSKIVELDLKRAVAMLRFNLTQPLTENIKQLKFLYTGGSSTFSAITGFGSVNSRQTEIRDVASGQKVFEVYTFPHAQEGKLKVTITALDANGTEVAETVMEEIPVEVNKISVYNGVLFDDTTNSSSPSIKVKGDGDWDGTINVN